MAQSWTDEERHRKRTIIAGLFRACIETVEAGHPMTGQACSRLQAIKVLRGMQSHVLRKFAAVHGEELACRYRALINEVLDELERQDAN